MKKFLLVCLLVVALAVGCGGGEDVENLEGKIEWTENNPSTCLYSYGLAEVFSSGQSELQK